MTNKVFISWEEYEDHIDSIVDWVQTQDLSLGAVYGLPRGGLPIAVSLSHRLHLPLLMDYYDRKIVTDKQILVVDDIADTGQTLNTFSKLDGVYIATIHYHQQSTFVPDKWVHEKKDQWIVYPWEKEYWEGN